MHSSPPLKNLQKRLERMAPELKGLPTVTQFARQLGQDQSAFHKWVCRHQLSKRLIRFGKYLFVPTDLQERYLSETARPGVERVSRRHSDHIGLRRAQAGSRHHWLFGELAD